MHIYSYFTHPNSVCMTYFEHMSLSLQFASLFFGAFFKAIIHAFFPSFFITSTTNTVDEVKYLLETNGCKR
jgi:hypothetical protein